MTKLTESSDSNSNTTNILIVDDDNIMRGVIKEMISHFGYTSSLASDGVEAVQELKDKEFDIIITDVHMPNMDGIELLRYARENYNETGVIVVTGYSDEHSYVDVINAGAIDYMNKPFNSDELHARLQRALREQALVKELKHKSIRDPLTKIFNRRHFDTKISEEVYRAVRQDYPVFLSLIDVDNFKKHNDTFGHQAGDQLLITVGEIMTSCARHNVDHVFRIGGDEFALIISQTNSNQALKICERIRKTFLESEVGETSLSIGITEFKKDPDMQWEESVSEFMKTTDRNLYKAKNGGRNKVVIS